MAILILIDILDALINQPSKERLRELHYSMDTILKTCQIVDKIKMKNEFEDKDILKTDSDKLCETITGRRYTQCSDRFLNNVIRKYQAYLQECEA